VQLRRWWATALIQGAQRAAHRGILGERVAQPTDGSPQSQETSGMFDGDGDGTPPAGGEVPFPLSMLQRFPALQGVPARLIAIGPLPEHAPEWARRSPQPAA
jgi:hypothetical protein